MQLDVRLSASGLVTMDFCGKTIDFDPFEIMEHTLAIDKVVDAMQAAPPFERWRHVGAMLTERFALPRSPTMFEAQAFCAANEAVFLHLKKNLDSTSGKVQELLSGLESMPAVGPAGSEPPGYTISTGSAP